MKAIELTQNLNAVGAFKGVVVQPEGDWFGTAGEKDKRPFMRIPVQVSEGEHRGKVGVYTVWMESNAFHSCLTEVFAFGGDLAELCQGKVTLAGEPCVINTVMAEHEGQKFLKVAWLSQPEPPEPPKWKRDHEADFGFMTPLLRLGDRRVYQFEHKWTRTEFFEPKNRNLPTRIAYDVSGNVHYVDNFLWLCFWDTRSAPSFDTKAESEAFLASLPPWPRKRDRWAMDMTQDKLVDCRTGDWADLNDPEASEARQEVDKILKAMEEHREEMRWEYEAQRQLAEEEGQQPA